MGEDVLHFVCCVGEGMALLCVSLTYILSIRTRAHRRVNNICCTCPRNPSTGAKAFNATACIVSSSLGIPRKCTPFCVDRCNHRNSQ